MGRELTHDTMEDRKCCNKANFQVTDITNIIGFVLKIFGVPDHKGIQRSEINGPWQAPIILHYSSPYPSA